jgi:hypothetical protein
VKLCRACVDVFCAGWVGQARGRDIFCLKCGVWGVLGMLWSCAACFGSVGFYKEWAGEPTTSKIEPYNKTKAGRTRPQHPKQTQTPHFKQNVYLPRACPSHPAHNKFTISYPRPHITTTHRRHGPHSPYPRPSSVLCGVVATHDMAHIRQSKGKHTAKARP